MRPGYIRPSQCESCVPVETEEVAGTMGRTNVHLAHQTECPNAPEAAQ